MAEPKAWLYPHSAGIRWKLVTGVRGWLCQESLAGGLQAGCPCLGEAPAECGVFHPCGTQRLRWTDASALRRAGTAQRSIRRPVGTVHRCFPHCQRGWDLTLPQEAARDRSVQTHRNSWSQVVAHKTFIHILVFSMWRCQAIA